MRPDSMRASRFRHLADRVRCQLVMRRWLRVNSAMRTMPCRRAQLEAGRVLIVSPHFDDEAIGCGGALILHKDIGSRIGVAFVSDSAGTGRDADRRRRISRQRKREAMVVSTALGYEILSMLDYPDGLLGTKTNEIASALAKIVDEWKPDQIMCPFPTDSHQDHYAVASAVSVALTRLKWNGSVWGFELWSTLWPNCVVDITESVDRKREAIQLYASQQRERDYASAIVGLNAYRALPYKLAHAEAYYRCGAPEFARIVSEWSSR